MIKIQSILKYIPNDSEIGVGLDLVKDNYHLYFLPGNRYNFLDNEFFYGGIGGHLEENESFIECARREAFEEIGVDVKLFSSDKTLYLQKGNNKSIKEINVSASIKPFALYEMVNPEGAPNQGGIYHIIIYKAELKEETVNFKKDEVSSLLGLTEEQILKSLNRKPTIKRLINEGALIIGNIDNIELENIVYPIGTAEAIAYILSELE